MAFSAQHHPTTSEQNESLAHSTSSTWLCLLGHVGSCSRAGPSQISSRLGQDQDKYRHPCDGIHLKRMRLRCRCMPLHGGLLHGFRLTEPAPDSAGPTLQACRF